MSTPHCPAQYNGCKWRGGVLKVDVAKPDFAARLAADWQQQYEREVQEAAAREAASEGAEQHVAQPRPGATMRIPRREGTKVRPRRWSVAQQNRTLDGASVAAVPP